MKYVSKLFLLMVLATLLISMQACEVPTLPYTIQISVQTPGPTAPPVSNIRMTTDETGAEQAIIYSPNQSFVVFLDLGSLQTGSVIEAKWYSVNVAGVTPNTLLNVSDYAYTGGIKNFHFNLKATGGGQWPAGSYKVEIYLNGVKTGEVPFYVN